MCQVFGASCTAYFASHRTCVVDDGNFTRPEYVVSDMLQPLPEIDLDFLSFDAAAVPDRDVHCDATDEARWRRPNAALAGQDRDAISDESFSSGTESSPVGFRKRHHMSPPRSHNDKMKLLQGLRGIGRGTRRDLPNTAFSRPPSSSHVCHDTGHLPTSESVSGQPVCRGLGRGDIRPAEFEDWQPESGRSTQREHDTSLGWAGRRSDEPANSAMTEDDLWTDAGHDLRPEGHGPIRFLRNQLERGGIPMSSAGGRNTSQVVERPRALQYSERLVSEVGLMPELDLRQSVASAAEVEKSLRSNSGWVRRRGAAMQLASERPAHHRGGGHADSHVMPEVELIKFESPVRCVIHSCSWWSSSEMTCIVSGGALNSTHSLTCSCWVSWG